jgi:hypothetical protein
MPPVFEVTVPAPLFATVSVKLGYRDREGVAVVVGCSLVAEATSV